MTTPTALDIRTNAFGMLQQAGVQDSTLTTLEFRNGGLHLEWKTTAGAMFRLEMGIAHHLRIADFTGPQILLDIGIWPLADASKAALIPAEAWRSLLSSTHHFKDIPAAATAAIIQHPGASFVLCDFSAGGDIAVIGEAVKLFSFPNSTDD